MILTDQQLVEMAADAAIAAQAGHRMLSIESGLRAIASTRAVIERQKLATETKQIVGTITEVGLVVLRSIFAVMVV